MIRCRAFHGSARRRLCLGALALRRLFVRVVSYLLRSLRPRIHVGHLFCSNCYLLDRIEESLACSRRPDTGRFQRPQLADCDK